MSDIIKKINISKDIFELITDLSVGELEKTITYAADKYYNEEPVISDVYYDILIDYLKLKSPKSKVLKNIGAKVKDKNKVNLDYWLGSMDKIKPGTNQLDIWTKKYNPPYNLSDKLDGISALLIYENSLEDKNIKMYTRGTSEEGLDISNLVKYLNLPTYDSIKSYCNKNKIVSTNKTNLIAFRGELIMKESVFKKNWSDKLKNVRNTVSGLVNSKTINPELARDVDLVLYEIVDPFYTINQQFEMIKDMGFKLVNNKTIEKNITYDFLSNYFKTRRAESEYLIDGIIVTYVKNDKRNTKGNPEYAFAFKDVLEEQIAKSKVTSIEWNISKNGYLIPTLIIDPVEVGGVMISRVTGHNARNIVDSGIGIGTELEVIRSGDVIPKIHKIIKPSTKPGLPSLKKVKWHWDKNNVDIIIDDIEDSKEVIIKTIYFFFSKLETKGLGEKIVERIVDAGYTTLPEFLSLKVDDLLEIDGFKEKSASNIINAIKKSVTDVSLPKFMAATNKLGEGIGEERMKLVLNEYPNLLDDYKKWSDSVFIDNIKKIKGWEDKTASILVSNFKEFIKLYDNLKKYITIKSENIIASQKTENNKSTINNLVFVFSGFRDSGLEQKIIELGGRVGSTVSGKTNYLVIKDESISNTNKVLNAKELGVKVITKNELITMLSKN